MFVPKLDWYREYRPLVPDEHICIFADPAEGNDYCAAAGFSKKHQDIPFVFNAKMESSQFGYELHRIAKRTESVTHIWPTIGVERNTGQATIYVLTQLNYPELFRMRIFDAAGFRESDKIGWLMTEATRRKMLDDYALALRQKVITLYDKEMYDQMRAFVVNKKGKPQAESNKNDDLVIAGAGSYQLNLLVPTRENEEVDETEFKKEQEKWRFR
jgi:hypothetical protein